jgi:5-methylcytosine-specific restriction endonuclease McrA
MQQDRWKEWVAFYIAEKPMFQSNGGGGGGTSSAARKRNGWSSRKKVPQAMRYNVWRRHFGEDQGVGKCFVCDKKITQMRFECGHVVSDANGGKCTEANLRPVCAECNKSMGKKNMDVYCKEHGYKWNDDDEEEEDEESREL